MSDNGFIEGALLREITWLLFGFSFYPLYYYVLLYSYLLNNKKETYDYLTCADIKTNDKWLFTNQRYFKWLYNDDEKDTKIVDYKKHLRRANLFLMMFIGLILLIILT